MSYDRPAFSGPFSAEGLEMLSPIEDLEDISREWAWGGSTGKGVKVAVIDSGIDATHPGIAGPVNGYVAVSTRGEEVIYDTAPHTDPYSHGTACATIIRSFAPECELYSVKVIGADLIGRGKVFAAGLRWAIENGMDVCNMSLGTTKKDFYGVLHQLTDFAYFNNVILVTAANNLPVPSFPSVYSSVISVGSHDLQDPYTFYYNPNPPVEFGACGINIRVAWLRGGWMTATGNSYATPHITGLVTKILGKHPNLTLFQVKSILRALSANVTREHQATHSTQNGDRPAASSGWKGWVAVPGDVTTEVAPAATIFGKQLCLLVTGSADQRVYVNAFDKTNWRGWLAMPADVTTDVAPATTIFGNRLCIFATSKTDRHIHVNTFDGSALSGWQAIPGDITTDVAPSVTVFDNQLCVFATSSADGRVYGNAFDGAKWRGWIPLPGDVTTDAAVATSVFGKRLCVFATSKTDRRIHVSTFDGSALSGWTTVPGDFMTDVAPATTIFSNRLCLFAQRADDSESYGNAFDGKDWNSWRHVPESDTPETVAPTVFGSELSLFRTGSDDKRVYQNVLS